MKKFVNILLVTLLVITVGLTFYACFASPEGRNAAISLNLIWGYVLLVGAVVAAVACAAWGLLKSPAGLKGALLSLLLMVAIVVASYFIAAGHDIKIVNLDTGGYFEHWKAVIAETGILVAYVAGAGAILSAIWSEVANTLK